MRTRQPLARYSSHPANGSLGIWGSSNLNVELARGILEHFFAHLVGLVHETRHRRKLDIWAIALTGNHVNLNKSSNLFTAHMLWGVPLLADECPESGGITKRSVKLLMLQTYKEKFLQPLFDAFSELFNDSRLATNYCRVETSCEFFIFGERHSLEGESKQE